MNKTDRFNSYGRMGSSGEDIRRFNSEQPIDEDNTVVVKNKKGLLNKLKRKFRREGKDKE